MRVLLVDDQPLFLEGLQNLLAAHDIEVAGTASDGVQALAQARALHPDVIVMDIQMPRCNGLEAARTIKAEMPEIKIVMLTVSGDDEDLFEAIKSGASGYLLKSLKASEFLDIFSRLAEGEVPLSRGLAAKILAEFARRANSTTADVSARNDKTEELLPRQLEVLSLVARGMTYREVGATLFLSERTVKYHMAQLLERLHLNNRASAIAYAERRGLVADKRADSGRLVNS